MAAMPLPRMAIYLGLFLKNLKTNLPKLRSHVGMVFQNFELFPHMTITENLTIGQEKVLGRSKDEARENGLKLLDRVGLMAQADKHPGQLSGGQQQRVAIARALAPSPKVLVADEPTGNLDKQTGDQIADLLFAKQKERGTTLLLVTHDPKLAARCDRMVRVSSGIILPEEATRKAAQ